MGKNRKSKSKVLPFSVFLGEFFNKRRREFKVLEDAINPARAVWKDMTEEQRAKYAIMAKARQAEKRMDMTNKLDSYGRPVTLVQELRLAEERREAEAREKTLAMVSDALANGTFLDRRYTIGHVHIFFKEIGDDGEVDHFPAEIGLATFCLGAGLQKGEFMHELVDSQPFFPRGMLSKAKESVERHAIDIFKHGNLMSKDFRGMMTNIDRVLKRVAGDGSTTRDPIFVRKDHYHSVKQSLKLIFLNAIGNATDEDLPDIFYLEDLYAALRKKTQDYCEKIGREIGKIWYPPTFIEDSLNSSTFDFASGTGCNFHEDIGDASRCSLGYSRQRAMLMMKDVCTLIGQELVAGKHVPEGYQVVGKQEH